MKLQRPTIALAIAIATLACEARSHAPKSMSDGGDGVSESGVIADAPSQTAPDGGGNLSPDAAVAKDVGADVAVSNDTGTKSAVCGNGVIESGEQCDPKESCPSSCPNRGCTKFRLEGSTADCTAHCVEMGAEMACHDNDGCCPTGCSAGTDKDCSIKCDNGVKEGMETCDPLSSCPASCPPVGCQLRKLVNPMTCTAECVNDRPQTSCLPTADGCCPSMCNSTNDPDCPVKCGNGVVESGETCDPVSTCTSMQSQCTSDKDKVRTPSGDPSKCTFVCTETARVCGAADGVCPTNCAAGADPDCKKAVGQACGGSGECSTGVCANGYCCSQSCSGACSSCAAADTGQANGACAPVTASKMCSPRTCSNGDVVEGHCSGGICQPQVVKACSATEECMNATCVPTCGNDGQPCCILSTPCSSTSLFCDDSGTCKVKGVNTANCVDKYGATRDDWCKSNYCGRSGFCLPCGALNQNCCTSGNSACNAGTFCSNGCPNDMLKPNDKDSVCQAQPSDPSFCQ